MHYQYQLLNNLLIAVLRAQISVANENVRVFKYSLNMKYNELTSSGAYILIAQTANLEGPNGLFLHSEFLY